MKSWKIEGYELAVLQCLYEGQSPKGLNYATLMDKGLVAESFGYHQLTGAGQRVLESIMDHLNSFDAGDGIPLDPKELIQHVDIEFENNNLEEADFIATTPV